MNDRSVIVMARERGGLTGRALHRRAVAVLAGTALACAGAWGQQAAAVPLIDPAGSPDPAGAAAFERDRRGPAVVPETAAAAAAAASAGAARPGPGEADEASPLVMLLAAGIVLGSLLRRASLA